MTNGTVIKEVILRYVDEDGELQEFKPNVALIVFSKMIGMNEQSVMWSSGTVNFTDPRLSESLAAQGQDSIDKIFVELADERGQDDGDDNDEDDME